VPALETQGFIVPGIELVKAGPRASVVRYFRSNDLPGARDAVQLLQKLGVRDIQARFVEAADNAAIRPCHYEAWFTDEALPPAVAAK
jgi:hypothetical protein